MSAPLLATKLFCPPPRPKLVSRSRLFERLDAGLYQPNGFTRKLTLISAPAGYGKTTLIAEWLMEVRVSESKKSKENSFVSMGCESFSPTQDSSRAAWLSLDESDNDPPRFLAYLITALRGVDDSIGETALPALQSPQHPPYETIIATLINDITAVHAPIILTLDDYHVINTPTIHQQVTYLLNHLPPKIHLVILTREDPLLPVARLRARGQVMEIRQEDLRFTPDETADFLSSVMGLSLSYDEIATLERRTEGWIAGLQLAALSMQGHTDLASFIHAFSGSSRFILDYLVEEVFERQSPDVQDFLLKTSILERLSGPLCNVVAQNAGSQELLESLEKANIFLIPLDQSRNWFRYHRLFTELLRHRLRASFPEMEFELHRRASCWFEVEGLTDEAIQYALAGRDWDRASQLIQSIYSDYLKRGEVLTVMGWFQELPEEYLQTNPKLCFDYCWPLLLAEQYDVAAPLLARLEESVKDHSAFLGEILAAQAYLARGVGDHVRMVERSQKALELLPRSSLHSRGIVALNLGLAYWHAGQMIETKQLLVEGLEAAQATGNQYAALTALIFMGRIFAVRGRLYQAERYFQDAIHQAAEIPINALAYMDLAELNYEWDELDVSETHLQKAIALCQRSQNDEFLVGCWLLGLRLRLARGDINGAEDLMELAWALVGGGKISSQMLDRLAAAQAFLLFVKGEPVGEWREKLTDKSDCHSFYRFLGVIKARSLPDAHARVYLERLNFTAQTNEWVYGLIAVLALQASLAESRADAIEFLTEALQLGENGGYIRSFVEVGDKLVPLLRTVLGRGLFPDYAGRILSVIEKDAKIAPAGLATLIEPLSERELQVLRLVTVGLSNREIADRLVISTGTAKSHVHHLCGKLGVRNRTEAAMKAKELGLL